MSTVPQTHQRRGVLQITSAIFSLLSAAMLLLAYIRIYLLVRSCERAPETCDVVPILTPLPLLVILALAISAILELWRRVSWPLIAVWALLAAAVIGEHIYYALLSVRKALDLAETSAMLVFAMLRDSSLLFCITGLVLALLSLLPAHVKMRQEEPKSV
jgi:hypothetical protein